MLYSDMKSATLLKQHSVLNYCIDVDVVIKEIFLDNTLINVI